MGEIVGIFDRCNERFMTEQQRMEIREGLKERYAEQRAAEAIFSQAREVTLQTFAARLAYQAVKQQPTQNIHGVRVGDLFFDSWGYEQTNIDFYQVVELKGKATAIIRELAKDYGEGYAMTGKVRPVRDSFVSEETFQRRTRTGYDGWPEVGSPRGDRHRLWPTSDDALHDYSSYY